jgi:hypothetical protein
MGLTPRRSETKAGFLQVPRGPMFYILSGIVKNNPTLYTSACIYTYHFLLFFIFFSLPGLFSASGAGDFSRLRLVVFSFSLWSFLSFLSFLSFELPATSSFFSYFLAPLSQIRAFTVDSVWLYDPSKNGVPRSMANQGSDRALASAAQAAEHLGTTGRRWRYK